MGEFEGRVAVVTGGASGIGRGIVVRLRGAGAVVITVDRDEAAGASLERELPGSRFLRADVTVAEEMQAVAETVADEYGRIDNLVCNAGIARDRLLLRMSEEDWDQVLAVNLKGAFTSIHACLRPILKSRYGSIVAIASVIGEMGNAGQANYAASKAGLVGLCRSVAREVAGRRVRVNVVSPGFIETRMTASLSDELRADYLARIPLGRVGTPEDVAEAVTFLLSDRASYITGQVIHVNGGLYP